MCKKNNQNGFSYLEVIFSILLLTIGIVAVLSSISMAMLRAQIGEKKNTARQMTSSALESIFAVRDLRNNNALNNWDAINNAGTLSGVFLTGWRPIRESSGKDGINGTADDACNAGVACPGTSGYTNTSPEIIGFQRRIVITDLPETGIPEIRKKRIDISVRYATGQIQQVENISTVITNLPFNQ
jgi:type II secretory pathway pseudopilin PulG